MILDERNEFADATTIPTPTATGNVGDIIDLGATTNYIGGSNARQMYLVVQVTTAVTSAGAATVDFLLVSDATTSIAVDGSATQHLSSGAIGKADLVAGYMWSAALPNGAYERYLAVQATVGTAALTAGAINAFLTYDPPFSHVSFPDASN